MWRFSNCHYFSLTNSHWIFRQRYRSRNSNTEDSSIGVSILPNLDHALEENPPLEPPINSPPGTNVEDLEVHRDRGLPPRKCEQIPIYIFLSPKESDPPFRKSFIECKQNLTYFGLEGSSTPASLQPITCKQIKMQHTFTWIRIHKKLVIIILIVLNYSIVVIIIIIVVICLVWALYSYEVLICDWCCHMLN